MLKILNGIIDSRTFILKSLIFNLFSFIIFFSVYALVALHVLNLIYLVAKATLYIFLNLIFIFHFSFISVT